MVPALDVADMSSDAGRGVHQGEPLVGSDRDRRTFLQHLLMAPLDRALAFHKRQDGPVDVAEQLHLDVPRVHQAALEVDGCIAERRLRLAAGGAQRARQVRLLGDEAHALAAAAGDGLEHHGIADVPRGAPRPRRSTPAVAPCRSGTTATPAARAAVRAAVLLPMVRMAAAWAR